MTDFTNVLNTPVRLNFNSRARRSEYWGRLTFWGIGSFFAYGILTVVTEVYPPIGGFLTAAFTILLLLELLAATVRRLHDSGKSGAWVLVFMIPFFGWIAWLFFAVADSDAGDNKYGPRTKTFWVTEEN